MRPYPEILKVVITGLVPVIHVGAHSAGAGSYGGTWMPGTSPGMTEESGGSS